MAAVTQGNLAEARRIFNFPEVAAIGFGYSAHGRRGSGVGSHMTSLLIETVAGSPALRDRGVRHVEEMQLLSAGIGPDRVSDIAANVFKSFLIDYTQRQSATWNLDLVRDVPIAHVYDAADGTWEDRYEDLPVGPDRQPILLVPRRFVRALPWINYDDFLRTEFAPYLAARRQEKASPAAKTGHVRVQVSKPEVVTVTRQDVALIERYVRERERQAADALPSFDYVDEDSCRQAQELKERLEALGAGRENAAAYQQLVLEILNYCFAPGLSDGELEVRTQDGTERRDIIFTNESEDSFWDYVRTSHDGIFVMFEAKNVETLDLPAINQTATYLGDRLGTFGVIVTRREPSESITRKLCSVWNDSAPKRKAILVLSDANLTEMLDLTCRNKSTTKWMQAHYRRFRTSLQ
ncbi:MAG TPA: hypothetical protein VN700_06530 [Vicinamibacterales bacterium]|nr:hypothetical protein [Vicinamibacterales bacterium]